MTIKELYNDYLGGSYDAVLARFRDDARALKFLRLFTKDESVTTLTQAVEKEDWATAFRAAHTLKGLALNMEFSALAKTSSELTEELRPCDRAPKQESYEAVQKEYQRILDGLAMLD